MLPKLANVGPRSKRRAKPLQAGVGTDFEPELNAWLGHANFTEVAKFGILNDIPLKKFIIFETSLDVN